MERWFFERYEDPIENTPYVTAEGGYIWIWGGPYDAAEVLGGEFGGIVVDEVIDGLVEDLESRCMEWTRVPRPDDYDEFISDIATIPDYQRNSLDGLEDIRRLAEVSVDDKSARCLFRVLYVNVITVLETYLSSAFIHTVLNDPGLVRGLIESTQGFQKRRVKLSNIYKEVDNAAETVRKYLGQITWHNVRRVMQLYGNVLHIRFPDIDSLRQAVEMRHDLVHRNGHTKEGEAIPIDKGQVLSLVDEVQELVEHIDRELRPVSGSRSDKSPQDD